MATFNEVRNGIVVAVQVVRIGFAIGIRISRVEASGYRTALAIGCSIGDAIVARVGSSRFTHVVDAVVVAVEIETIGNAVAVDVCSGFDGVEDAVVVVIQVREVGNAVTVAIRSSKATVSSG